MCNWPFKYTNKCADLKYPNVNIFVGFRFEDFMYFVHAIQIQLRR